MNRSQFYLSHCADAAEKSPMCFTLGAVLVKGGKVISSGFNHHRPHYDGAEATRRGHSRKPVSMHAEMHAIYNATGMSPAFRQQVQGKNAAAARGETGAPGSGSYASDDWSDAASSTSSKGEEQWRVSGPERTPAALQQQPGETPEVPHQVVQVRTTVQGVDREPRERRQWRQVGLGRDHQQQQQQRIVWPGVAVASDAVAELRE
ncbi:hypothetical protein EXIGLDRAFT_716873 [Exidia glandulosa HHB12029]|uniref:CMP/dCMP-type deaminase domain-containing protein n=1 Tax=Exidia glandulosa HHB12029 TaxID=1314781 RepID=A0A165IN36_EXIGL|nr:hypothetical protein EXIGLDRAFT_716873 [Exidia glandulosa HHB12029]